MLNEEAEIAAYGLGSKFKEWKLKLVFRDLCNVKEDKTPVCSKYRWVQVREAPLDLIEARNIIKELDFELSTLNSSNQTKVVELESTAPPNSISKRNKNERDPDRLHRILDSVESMLVFNQAEIRHLKADLNMQRESLTDFQLLKRELESQLSVEKRNILILSSQIKEMQLQNGSLQIQLEKAKMISENDRSTWENSKSESIAEKEELRKKIQNLNDEIITITTQKSRNPDLKDSEQDKLNNAIYQLQLENKNQEILDLQRNFEEFKNNQNSTDQIFRTKVSDLEAEIEEMRQKMRNASALHAAEMDHLKHEITDKVKENEALHLSVIQKERTYEQRIEALSREIDLYKEPPEAPLPPPIPTEDVSVERVNLKKSEPKEDHQPKQKLERNTSFKKQLRTQRKSLHPMSARTLKDKPLASQSLSDLIYSSLQQRFLVLQTNIHEEDSEIEELTNNEEIEEKL